MDDDSPKFMHDCDECVFLGHFEKHDLYYCPQDQTLTGRYDHDQTDYIIALAEATTDPILGEAFRRAQDRGLLYDTSDQNLFGTNVKFSDDDW